MGERDVQKGQSYPGRPVLRSREIDPTALGFTREEALGRLNLGYVWHAIWALVYMFFVVGGRLIVSVYRIDVTEES